MRTIYLTPKIIGYAVKACIALALMITMYNVWFFVVGETAEGYVTHNEARGRSKGQKTYRPHVQFNTPEGQTIRFASTHSSRPAWWGEGEQVRVLYLKSNPNFARIDAFVVHWIFVLALLFSGTVFHIIGRYALPPKNT